MLGMALVGSLLICFSACGGVAGHWLGVSGAGGPLGGRAAGGGPLARRAAGRRSSQSPLWRALQEWKKGIGACKNPPWRVLQERLVFLP